jgi:CheY-like chemotaxis protein
VDDEQVACDILSKYLRTDGHRVECVSCGEDALARLQTEGIDLMLTDHGMPGMNGVQLIDAARAFGHQQPVILMSGVDLDPRNKPDFVDSVLRKPIQQRDLRKLLAGIALN